AGRPRRPSTRPPWTVPGRRTRSCRRRTRAGSRRARRERAKTSRRRRAGGDPSPDALRRASSRLVTLLLRDAEVDDERAVIRADVRPVPVVPDAHSVAEETVVERYAEQRAPGRPAVPAPGVASVQVAEHGIAREVAERARPGRRVEVAADEDALS